MLCFLLTSYRDVKYTPLVSGGDVQHATFDTNAVQEVHALNEANTRDWDSKTEDLQRATEQDEEHDEEVGPEHALEDEEHDGTTPDGMALCPECNVTWPIHTSQFNDCDDSEAMTILCCPCQARQSTLGP